MPNLIQARTANDAWLQAVDLLLTCPDTAITDSRNGRTTELLHVTITVEDPRQRWVFARQPVISPAFALAEAIWIIAGRNDSSVLNFFNQDLHKYAGDGPTFYGAYGHRLRHQHGFDQLETAIQALSTNSTSRQIVLQIWDPKTDLPGKNGQPRSPDVPCNTQAFLRVQNGKLHWLQTMRSNDIFRGLPYNFVQFTTLHEVMAGWLGLELGNYTHVVSCLHLYHSDLCNLEKIKRGETIPNPDSLSLSKSASAESFAFLSELITSSASGIEGIARFAQRLDLENLPIAIQNIANIILAEAARRHSNLDMARHHLSKTSNACLRSLAESFFARFQRTAF